MPDIEDVLEDAQREIKSIGDNVKTLKDNMEKNLADVLKIAEDAPKVLRRVRAVQEGHGGADRRRAGEARCDRVQGQALTEEGAVVALILDHSSNAGDDMNRIAGVTM